MSAKQRKNRVLTGIISNIISPNSVLKSTDPIDAVLLIPNVKLVDPAVFLLSWTEISSCCNAFNWPLLFINWVEALKSINNFLNSVLLYYKSVNKFET